MQSDDKEGITDESGSPFARAVRYAYFVDYGFEEDKAIAEAIGTSTSNLSQHLGKSPLVMKGETIGKIIAPLRAPELVNEVLVAWSKGIVSRKAVEGGSEPWRKAASGYLARNRPDLALRVSLDAFDDPGASGQDRWVAFMQAISCCFRLDLPGESMSLCGKLRDWGEQDGLPELVAAAHAAGSRAMRRTTLFGAAQVAEERDRAEAALRGLTLERDLDQADLRKQAGAFAMSVVTSERINDLLRLQELKGDRKKELEQILATELAKREGAASSAAGRARASQAAARVLLALKRPDDAERYVRESLEQGAREPSVRLEGEHLLGRLLAERGRTEEALVQLGRAAKRCADYRFVYLGRVIESEIARIELASMRGA